MLERTKVYLVDGHEVVHHGVACLFRNTHDLELYRAVLRGEDAYKFLLNCRASHVNTLPDVIVTELTLPGIGGLAMIKELVAMFGDSVKILVYTAAPEELYGIRALRAGAKGFVSKSFGAEPFVAAIRRVAVDKLAFSDEISEYMFILAREDRPVEKAGTASLSDREMEVFRHLGQGSTTKEIAERMHLSPKTIETYRENIKAKLNLAHAQALIRAAVVHVVREEEGLF